MTNWIEEVLEQHKELETPLTFFYWAGLAAISASVKDNIWLFQQFYNVYPNIYVMLHAKSGLKKGPAISMAKQIVKQVNNTRIISGRSSIQGILKELGTGFSQPGGVIVNKAIAFICSSELSSSVVEDKAAMSILTDLYDRNWNEGDWKSLLKSESFKLKDPTITMLTATNEAHSDEFFGKQDIQGGYFARTFIIYADTENCTNSLVDPLIHPPDYKKLAEYVKELSKLKGPFIPLYQTEAGDFYKAWYNDFAQVRKDIVDDTGTLNRFGDSVLKVAMLLSLAREPILKISLEAMQEAVIQCEKLIGHTRRVTMGRKGKSSFANQKVMIIEKLLKRDNHMITRAQLMMDMHYHLNANELDEIMRGFDEAGLIKVEAHGNTQVYVMPEAQVVTLQDWMKGKNK
jgi:hypothetical protein